MKSFQNPRWPVQQGTGGTHAQDPKQFAPVHVVSLSEFRWRAHAPGHRGRRLRGSGYIQVARAIAAGGSAWSIGPVMAAETGDAALRPPHLSEREHRVLMAYASGLTLASTARQLGISTETAKTYLMRVKAKYRQAGLPVRTKLDLAERVRADCAGVLRQWSLPRAEAGRPPGTARIEG